MKNRLKGLKLLIILISFILTIVIIPGVLADEVTVSIGKIAADPEGRCTAPVVLSSITDYGTGAITLKYDPSIAHVTDVTGSEDSTVVAWNADNEIGETKIAAWNINGVSGNIDFATITFRAANKSGSTPLTITVDELITMDEEGVQKKIDAKVINGKFTAGTNSTPGFGLLQVLIVFSMIFLYYNKIINKNE